MDKFSLPINRDWPMDSPKPRYIAQLCTPNISIESDPQLIGVSPLTNKDFASILVCQLEWMDEVSLPINRARLMEILQLRDFSRLCNPKISVESVSIVTTSIS